ncbi:MAG: PBP1A family penicillin-binding protein [Hyphomicrobium sp.]|jgi:penicillin-binding protein 1A
MGTNGHDDSGAHQASYIHSPVDHAGDAAPSGRSALPLGVRILLVLPVIAVSLAMASVGVLFIYYTMIYPDPLSMRPKTAGPVVRILANDGSVLVERGLSRAYIPLDLLPAHVTNAVVAIEDRRFYEHPGLDIAGLARALFVNLRSGRFVQGGSTLTQQLAKNLFLTSQRTLSRKAEEVVLALWLELKLSKHDILELYLNRVYFGAGAHGIEAAAQRYFNKSATALSIAEGAVIAGLLKAPSKYAPSSSPQVATGRGRVVLGCMRDAGFITEAEEIAAKSEDVRFSASMRAPEHADVAYASDYVLDRVAPFDGLEADEITVETTLDANLQRRAGEILARELDANGAALSASQAALVVLAPDGGIRALVGGRSYAESQFNRAVQARRQPGSAFKPVVYLTAVESGRTPDSIVKDEPVTLGTWSPKNENGRYLGATTLRDALAHSINTVAVRLVQELGAPKVAGTAERLGMKSVLRTDASLALGTSEVSLLELTGAYGAFANGGYVHEPYVVRCVSTSSGRILFKRLDAHSGATIAAEHVGQMNDMLHAAMVNGTGRRAALPEHPAAGKTGTSQDFRDAWFVGYTAYFTGGVWVGNDNAEPMNKVRGGSLPAEIWRQVMLEAHRGRPPHALPDSSGRIAPPEGAQVAAESARASPLASREVAPIFPGQRIDADFVSRALGKSTLEPRDIARGETSIDAVSASIVVKPPERR